MPKPPKIRECEICGESIQRVRTPEGMPRFAWKSEVGFYCPRSGLGWHYPKDEER